MDRCNLESRWSDLKVGGVGLDSQLSARDQLPLKSDYVHDNRQRRRVGSDLQNSTFLTVFLVFPSRKLKGSPLS